MSDSLHGKFVAAWLACENPALDSENPHFGNRFASLRATLAAVREACSSQGIAYVQCLGPVGEDGRAKLSSCVVDGEGNRIDLSAFPVDCPPNPQSFGSNLTYAKRQQAQADWGVTGETDDDGNAAADYTSGRKAKSPLDSAIEGAARACGCTAADVKAAVKAAGIRKTSDAIAFCGAAEAARTLNVAAMDEEDMA